jgi:hypothetical protein
MKTRLFSLVLVISFLVISMGLVAVDARADWSVQHELPLSQDLNDVWGSGPDDVYAVGQLGALFHYNGADWTQVVLTGMTNTLTGVWGTAANDVFAVGNDTIMHYDGTGWSGMYIPPAWGPGQLEDVWGTASDNVFAVGGGLNPGFSGSDKAWIYNGTTWSVFPQSFGGNLHGVWGTDANNVFAAGSNGDIHYYNGTLWDSSDSGTGNDLTDVWGLSASDSMYAAGQGCTILNFNSLLWTTETSCVGAYYMGLWGTDADHIFAVGLGGSSDSRVTYYDGSAWSHLIIDGTGWLNGIWGSSLNDIFAVGDDGLIMHWDGDSNPPTTTVSLPGGEYSSNSWVSLACDDAYGIGCDATYYTTDGTTPTAASTLYSASFLISSSTTLKFFSVDKWGNDEAVNTETYTIGSGSDGDSGGDGCFIATAAYGSYWNPDVMVLRDFRDRHLLTNPIGRTFVRAYYRFSPPVADYIARREALKAATRITLYPVVYSVKYPILPIALCFVASGAIVLRRRKK